MQIFCLLLQLNCVKYFIAITHPYFELRTGYYQIMVGYSCKYTLILKVLVEMQGSSL